MLKRILLALAYVAGTILLASFIAAMSRIAMALECHELPVEAPVELPVEAPAAPVETPAVEPVEVS